MKIKKLLLLLLLLVITWFSLLLILPFHATKIKTVDRGAITTIPKQIWTFWNSESLPVVVDQCISTWKQHCVGYSIVVLTPGNLKFYLPNADEVLRLRFANTPQRLADYVRLHVLYEHGGYWMDASILLSESIENIFDQTIGSEFLGYYIDKFTVDSRFPVIESWMFGCVKHSTFVGAWLKEFMRVNRYFSVYSYVDHARMHGVILRGIPYFLSYYLTIHVSLQVILQMGHYPIHKFQLHKAEEGPFRYLAKNGWSSERAVNDLKNTHFGIAKLRKAERRYLEKNYSTFFT